MKQNFYCQLNFPHYDTSISSECMQSMIDES